MGGIEGRWAEDVGLEDRNKLAPGFTQNNLVIELVILAAGVVVVHVRHSQPVFWREGVVGPDGEEVFSSPLRAGETVVADVAVYRPVRQRVECVDESSHLRVRSHVAGGEHTCSGGCCGHLL